MGIYIFLKKNDINESDNKNILNTDINDKEKNNIENDSNNVNNNNNNREEIENRIDVNLFINSNRNIIQKRTTKKKRLKGEQDKNYKLIKEYDPDDCALNFSKDLKCECIGNIDNTCYIF